MCANIPVLSFLFGIKNRHMLRFHKPLYIGNWMGNCEKNIMSESVCYKCMYM